MFLKPLLDLAPYDSEEQIPNLVELGARCVHIAKQIEHHPTTVIVANDRKEIELYLHYLSTLGIEDVHYYPSPSLSPYEWTGEERRSSQQRHAIRYRLLNTDTPPRCIIMSYHALTHLIMDNITWYQATLSLYPGDRISPTEIVQKLIQVGYEPVAWVTEAGQFTRRGAVIDVFPIGLERVTRIEWFDDEIEKIYSYRLNDTIEKPAPLKQATIPPPYEWVIPSDLERLKTRLQENHRGNFIQLVREFQYQPELYQIMSLLHGVSNILGSLPVNSLIVWPEGQWHKAKAFAHLLDETAINRQIEPQHFTLEQLKEQLKNLNQQFLNGHNTTGSLLPSLESNLAQMAARLKQLSQERLLTIVTPQPQRVSSFLQEYACPVSPFQNNAQVGRVWVIQGKLNAGFAYQPLNWLCYSDRELFPREGSITKPQKRKRTTSPIQMSQLKENMLVVHDIHGVGRYQGLVQYSTTGETREYLSVNYAGTDRLLVPVEQMHRLQIYHGVGGEKVKLHKLGGSEWEKAKNKVRQDLVEIAENLLRTEANRMQATGIAFPPDTEWQREMEFAFPYKETPDQLQAILDIKSDMESELPMNRLVCGDVGFGKTEVALRAAFKAAISGYQVAVLAPTTILAHQHYQVLRERFAPYPLRIELLSRYRTQKESDRVFQELSQGNVDIVIATHRLLSKKLDFKKLGLLVIDEEHRFGVTQKEKLKDIQANIDILTMSATPIPRTLNIAMGGLKSLSLIETPPPNRQPIQTIVEAYQDDVIKKAIYHELQRGGQIYYIHNRVKSIREVEARIHQLAPQARLRVAHGQMSKQELERTMWDFYHHEFDILICTTIVESGLDISNVNTLIIEHVELLGLAQIHQLRGRVGRSNIQAYAYMLYDPHHPLTREARERLSVVQEYSDLGSGYFLALKDMEIRGIGNLIGPQQHGNILTVGFETYCELLEEAIANLKGEPASARPAQACIIDLNLAAYLPETWVSKGEDKLKFYRALAYAQNLDYLTQLKIEAEEQYGTLPQVADTLWRVTAVRILAQEFRFVKMTYQGDKLELHGLINERFFKAAKGRNPELKHWEWQADRLIHPRASKSLRNLQIIERWLEALLHAETQWRESEPMYA